MSCGTEVHPHDRQHGYTQRLKAASRCHIDAAHGDPNVAGLYQGGVLAEALITVLPSVCVIDTAPFPISSRGLDGADDGIGVPKTLVILTVNIRALIFNTMSITSRRCGIISYFKPSSGSAWGTFAHPTHSIVRRNGGNILIFGRPANNSDRASFAFSCSFSLSFSLSLPFSRRAGLYLKACPSMKAGPTMKAAPYQAGGPYLKADPYQEVSRYLKSGLLLKNDLYLKTRTRQNAVSSGHMTSDPHMTNSLDIDEEYTLIDPQQSMSDHTERRGPRKTEGGDCV